MATTASTFVSQDLTAATITLNSVVGLPAIGYVDIVTAGGTETVFYNYISDNTLSNVFRAQIGTTQQTPVAGNPFASTTPPVSLMAPRRTSSCIGACAGCKMLAVG